MLTEIVDSVGVDKEPPVPVGGIRRLRPLATSEKSALDTGGGN